MAQCYLVTGGTSGIGEAVVRKMIAQSTDPVDQVIVVYGHSDQAAKEFRGSLPAADQAKVTLLKADLSDRAHVTDFVSTIAGLTSRLDGAVLNIGVGTYKPFVEYEFEDWDRVIETNLTIPVFVVQSMLKQGLLQESSVVMMASLAGILPYSSSVAYGISKAGLAFAAKTLVKELEPSGSRINAIAPGFIETRWQDGRSDESYARINKKIALHRFGTPEEVADATYSVLTNRYINGSVLAVDGGYDYF